jgi:hypothetical protein
LAPRADRGARRRRLPARLADRFQRLVSSRYERASLIVISDKPFGRWGEIFGDDTAAAARHAGVSIHPSLTRRS